VTYEGRAFKRKLGHEDALIGRHARELVSLQYPSEDTANQEPGSWAFYSSFILRNLEK
jgi:hypothetical protein